MLIPMLVLGPTRSEWEALEAMQGEVRLLVTVGTLGKKKSNI